MTTNREFKFACPVCQQHLQCEVEAAGRVVTCPTCMRELIVPQALGGHLARLVVRAKEVSRAPAARPQTAVAATPADPRAGMTTAVAGLLLAATSSAILYVLMR